MTEEQMRLVESNLPLVRLIVGRHYRRTRQLGDFEDTVQIGNIGLCKAAQTFKPEKGYKFTTYATKCVRNEINMAIRAQNQLMRASEADSISLDAQTDDGHGTLLDLIPDPGTRLEQQLAAQERYQKLLEAFQDEPVLLEVATGQMTQQEAAELLGITQSWVSRRVKSIISKLIESEDQNGKNQHDRGGQLS